MSEESNTVPFPGGEAPKEFKCPDVGSVVNLNGDPYTVEEVLPRNGRLRVTSDKTGESMWIGVEELEESEPDELGPNTDNVAAFVKDLDKLISAQAGKVTYIEMIGVLNSALFGMNIEMRQR